jgi:hypothetical protein
MVEIFLSIESFIFVYFGELAQLARALAWHARGRRFDSDILHFYHHQIKLIACKLLIFRRSFFQDYFKLLIYSQNVDERFNELMLRNSLQQA